MLMVLFHFSFFVTEHEMLTGFVYAFHMSGFLIVSGYLLNVDKSLSLIPQHYNLTLFISS